MPDCELLQKPLHGSLPQKRTAVYVLNPKPRARAKADTQAGTQADTQAGAKADT